jgi:hypothetical protein
MKRNASSPLIDTPNPPEHKRAKTAEDAASPLDADTSEWTKVERRKNKKSRKVEAKLEVGRF